MGRKRGYKFTDKQHAKGGVVSIVLAVAAVSFLLSGVYISFQHRGNAGELVGVLGTIGLGLSLIGTIIALLGFREEDKFYLTSWIGSVVNCMIWMILGGMILVGI